MDTADWKALSYVKRSKYRRKALEYLYEVDEPRTPTEISSKIEVSMNHVSRALREMKATDNERLTADLVEVINPEDSYDRRYQITEKGKTLVEKMQEIAEE